MFWGLTLKPGKRHTEIFSEEICLSMATLESRKDFGERPDNYSHVVVKTQKSDFLLCTLVHGLQFQQNLNLKLMPKEKITFRVQGTSKVYLTGFSPSCPVEDVDIGEEEEEEDEEETLNQAGASQEQKDGDQEDAGWLVDDCDTADDIVEDVIEALSGEELNRPEDQAGQSGRGAMSGGKEDNFLSVTELSNLPVKEEGMEECDSEISQEHSKNQISEGGRKEVRSKSSSSLITDNIDEDGSSMEGSGDEWILDEGEDVEEPEEDVSEVEEGVEDDDGSVGERQQIAKVPCDVCDQEFNTEEEKLKHEENDHRLSPPNSQVQLTNSSLVKKRRTYKCRYCNKLLANINSKKRHEAIHAREQKLFTCQYCPKVFSYHHNLVRHRKMHKPTSMLYRCLICNAGFQHIQLRDKHVLGHFKKDAQRCDLCRQVTCKGECMPTEEILNSQSLKEEQDNAKTGVRYKCEHCPKSFQLKASRNRHQKVHAASSSPSPSQSSKKPENSPQSTVTMTEECKYCYKAFPSNVQCKTHERTHTGEQRPFSCRCCQKTFLDHSGRRKHELRHPEMRKFGCKFCHKRFSKQNLWQIHEAQHSEGKPFKCRFCDRCFSNKGNRVNHEVVHKKGGSIDVPDGVANMDSTKGNPSQSQAGSSPKPQKKKTTIFPCRICGKIFGSKSGRYRHQKLHEGLSVKRSSCVNCGKAFINQTKLLEHKCKPDNNADFACKVCNATFSDKESLATHQQKHKASTSSLAGTVCRFCKKEFSSRSACVIHVRLHTGEKPCCCTICEFKTGDPSSLSKHMKKQHTSLPLRCSFCSRKFVSQYSLQIHESQHRADKAVHTCNECDKKFSSRKQLDFHRQVHTEPESFRPFRCTYCSKTFAAPETLKRHEHIHEKEQPFKCVKCGRHFKTSNGLQKHSLICTDGKPHKCRYCSKSFSSSNGCHLHEESHIVDRPFKCTHCERGFLSNHSREMHEKTHTL